ncbi:ATP nucleotide 3'-pyrophosphokinase [Streptomyces sp. XM4193]|uniref:ATP nucleotide 3'-pyrophosphokinase n=1 Tax=Streptomyces sp. XM4193 TaxID=2929782 RepID=UPI001FFA1635|nr:ATP nucleotide 3'-pyrophosphokinase [Streptomyces sp. XM4193]MCK1794692.1 ATP nucleotide 3'-pyrophosphokinase [Streptomyces sp. XM4193]
MSLQLRAPRAVTGAVLATALAAAVAVPATATAAPKDSGWQKDGLRLNAQENRAVDAFLDRARDAEKEISAQVRTVASWSDAELVGFDKRLKTEDSLKRKIATWLRADPEQSVHDALGDINDSIRYTFQWPEEAYTDGAETAARMLTDYGHANVRWSNTWKNRTSYKAINTAWADARTKHKFEIQLHTPASRQAATDTHPLYEEQRLPDTPPKRVEELARQQGEIFAAVPVPEGATELTAPAARVPAGG